jgi:hypothetical protein
VGTFFLFYEAGKEQLDSPLSLHKETLADLWRRLFETEPPIRMRRELVLQFVAYRVQEKEFGSLSEGSHRRLGQVVKAIEDNSNSSL